MTLHKSKNLKKIQKKSVHQGLSDDMPNYFSALKASLFLKCEMGNHENFEQGVIGNMCKGIC